MELQHIPQRPGFKAAAKQAGELFFQPPGRDVPGRLGDARDALGHAVIHQDAEPICSAAAEKVLQDSRASQEEAFLETGHASRAAGDRLDRA